MEKQLEDDFRESETRKGRGPRKQLPKRRVKMVEAFDPSNPYAHTDPRKRIPDAHDPLIAARQIKAFELRVACYSLTQICEIMQVSRDTVARDIRFESIKRMEEAREDREHHILQHIATVDRQITILESSARKSREEAAQRIIDQDFKTAVALRMVAASDSRSVVALLIEKSKLLGARAAVKLEVEDKRPVAMQSALDVFLLMSPDQRRELNEMAAQAKAERMKDVTPR